MLDEEGLKTVLVYYLYLYWRGHEGSLIVRVLLIVLLFLPFSAPVHAGGLRQRLTSPVTCCRLAHGFDQNQIRELLLIPTNSFLKTEFSCSMIISEIKATFY